MKNRKVDCVCCGAALQISEDIEYLECPFCGSFFQIQRQGDFWALKQIKATAPTGESDPRTNQAIDREEASITLRRTRLKQEYATSVDQLNDLRSEIRRLSYGTITDSVTRQITDLHWLEFKLLERMRILQGNIAELDSPDLTQNVPFLQDQLSNLEIEITLVCEHFKQTSEMVKLGENLQNEKKKWAKALFEANVKDIQNSLTSFYEPCSSEDNQEVLREKILSIDKDIAGIKQLGPRPELYTVEKALNEKRQQLYNRWLELEESRVSGALHTRVGEVRAIDLEAVGEELVKVREDIQWLGAQPVNEVVDSHLKRLKCYQVGLERRLNPSNEPDAQTSVLAGSREYTDGDVVSAKRAAGPSSALKPEKPNVTRPKGVYWTLAVVLVLALGGIGFIAANQAKKSETASSGASQSLAATDTTGPTVMPEGTTTIIVYSNLIAPENVGMLEQYAAAYRQTHPNVSIKWETKDTGAYFEEVEARLSSGNYGDILSIPYFLYDEKLVDYLAPLGKTAEIRETYRYLDGCSYHDQVYCIGIDGGANGMFFNKEIFKAAGITTLPKTPEAFLADLKLIRQNTKTIPLYIGSENNLSHWSNFAFSISGDPGYWHNTLVHDKAPYSPGRPLYVAHKVLFDAVRLGYSEKEPLSIGEAQNMFIDGKIAVLNADFWLWEFLETAAQRAGKDPSIIGFMPFPSNIDGRQFTFTSGAHFIGIHKNSANQEEVKELFTWLLDQSSYALDQNRIPARIDSKLPSHYDDFVNADVVFLAVAPAAAGEEGLYYKIRNESNIGYLGELQQAVIDAARGKGQKNFSGLMATANEQWATARKTLGVK